MMLMMDIEEEICNPPTWHDIFTRYLPLILSRIKYWNYLSFGFDSDDLIQEVRIRIWKAMEYGKPINNYASYIYKITNSVMIDHLRKYKNIFEYDDDKMLPFVSGSSTVNGKNEFQIMEDRIREKLPMILESRRKVLSFYMCGLSLEEIAILKKFTIAKTRSLYFRAVCDIKQLIQ